MRVLIVCIILLFAGSIAAQNAVNQLDAQGRKQGFWTKKDADGKLLYQGTFKNDQPVGEMKRFHPNGKLKAVLNFVEGSEISDAILYDERGNLIAQGKYNGQMKTGEWSYFKDTKIVSTESYLNGQKNGISKKYYSTGELMEESNWKDDKRHGTYSSYFQDGICFLKYNYVDGRLNGSFQTWFPNGVLELDANYYDDLRDKDWKYFSESGEISYTLKYELGNLLNPEVQDSIDAAQSDTFKTREDKIPDPEKFMQNPEEYMNLIKIR
jgi:antitoxin component YwqK of YwqJK toxin-antitoxin module